MFSFPPHPNPPPQGGRALCFSLPHQGGGSFVSPSPTRGEGALFLPPPPGGRELCFSLPHQGGGRTKAPSPLVGEGWGGGREKCHFSLCPVLDSGRDPYSPNHLVNHSSYRRYWSSASTSCGSWLAFFSTWV